MLAFLTNPKGPIFQLSFKYFAFLTQIRKSILYVAPTKTKECGAESICGFELTKLVIYRFFDYYVIIDVITISY